jgi:hypothetical protein
VFVKASRFGVVVIKTFWVKKSHTAIFCRLRPNMTAPENDQLAMTKTCCEVNWMLGF